MKTLLKISTVLTVGIIFVQAGQAAPRTVGSGGRKYLKNVAAATRWTCGGYWDMAERDVEAEGIPARLKTSRGMAFVGYSPVDWATLYLTMGESFSDWNKFSAGNTESVGLGLQLNLLDHEVADPGLMEDRFLLNAAVEYLWTGADPQWPDNLRWGELTASLTFSIVNDITGNALFTAKSIALYAGPVVSALVSGDLEGKDSTEAGVTAGMEVFLTERVSLNAQFTKMDYPGYGAGLTVRF